MFSRFNLGWAIGLVLLLAVPVVAVAAGDTLVDARFWHQDVTGVEGEAGTGDEFGRAVASGDFNGDGYIDLAVGVAGEEVDGQSEAGAVNVFYGGPDGLDSSVDQLWHQGLSGITDAAESGDMFGWALAAGDFNGDGYIDLAVGVPDEDVSGVIDCGAVAVFYGSATGLADAGDQLWIQGYDGLAGGAEAGDRFGSAIACGDFDNDGYSDLIVGTPDEDVSGQVDCGVLYVIYGSESGLGAADHHIMYQGGPDMYGLNETNDRFANAVGAGDLNGDTYDDLVVGVEGENGSSGMVQVVYGSTSGLTATGNHVLVQGEDGILDSAEPADKFGFAVAVEDFDGDGYMDLAVGVPNEDLSGLTDCGAVSVIYGGSAGLASAGNQLWEQDSVDMLGVSEAGDMFGHAVACGDLNGDGFADLAVGAPYEDSGALAAGAVGIVFGSASGLTAAGNQLWLQDSTNIPDSCEENDYFGRALAWGDFDGDGNADLAVGIPGEDLEGDPGDLLDAGAVDVLYFTLFDDGFVDRLIGTVPEMTFSTVNWGNLSGWRYQEVLVTGYWPTGGVGPYHAGVYGGSSHFELFAELQGVNSGSSALADFDRDGDLDILLTGWGMDALPFGILYRNDDPAFTDISAGLPGVVHGSVAWGDYDNDGDPDILLTGVTSIIPAWERDSVLYRNDYPDFTEDVDVVLPAIEYGSVAWGDYDNDGDLDILMTGNDGSGGLSRIYRNTGGSFAEDTSAGLVDVDHSAVAWGDYDNDGDLDILLAGDTGAACITKIYRNDAPGFTDIGAPLAGVRDGSVAWGDCDSDGDLDILLTGDADGTCITKIYRNDDPVFWDIGDDLPGVCEGEAAWGDYGVFPTLDFVITGSNLAKLYESTAVQNSPPAQPTNLSAHAEGSQITFTWDPATDPETPAPGLNYTLRVGTTPGGSEICSASASDFGFMKYPVLGNMNHNTSWTITAPDPPPPVYYWTVFAIDNSFQCNPMWPVEDEEEFTLLSDVPENPLQRAFALGHSAPNPFNPRTTIAFELPRQEAVSLRVFDVAGHLVRVLIDREVYDQGRHEAVWRGRDDSGRQMSSGTYFYRLEAGGFSETKRMVLVK